MITNPLFDEIILFLIVLSSLKLAVDTYLDESMGVWEASKIIDKTFNSLFIAECVFKVTALGFVADDGSYL